MSILVTGVAGFIGFHVALSLLQEGEEVVGVDLPEEELGSIFKKRLSLLRSRAHFHYYGLDIAVDSLERALDHRKKSLSGVIHLAAKTGVRASIVNPFKYSQTNITGHLALLEFARTLPALKHFVFASSSSVYGRASPLPFREGEGGKDLSSFYAVSKRSAELTSETYAYLYGIPQTALRLFTVYGPWGRPDMAYYKFTDSIVKKRPIALFDDATLGRDFTYIDDVVRAIMLVYQNYPVENKIRVLNVGSGKMEKISDLITVLEKNIGLPAKIQRLPRPLTDMPMTCASIESIKKLTGWRPSISIEEGMPKFVSWYKACCTSV